MLDHTRKTGVQEDLKISLRHAHEREYWAEALGVTEEKLQRAVEKVGPIVADVRREISKG